MSGCLDLKGLISQAEPESTTRKTGRTHLSLESLAATLGGASGDGFQGLKCSRGISPDQSELLVGASRHAGCLCRALTGQHFTTCKLIWDQLKYHTILWCHIFVFETLLQVG